MYDWQVLGTFHVDTNHFLRVSVLGHVLAIVSFSPMTVTEIEAGCDRYRSESWQLEVLC